MKRLKWIFDIGARHFDESTPRGPGWAYHMGFFCIIAIWCMFCFSVGIPLRWVVLLISVAGIIDMIGTWVLLRAPLKRLQRLGIRSVARPRFWIESSAVLLTLGFSAGVFVASGGIPIPINVPANFQNVAFRFAIDATDVLFIGSYICTAIAYVLGLAQDRTPSGKSLELVAFFFWMMVLLKVLDVLLRLGAGDLLAIVAVSVGAAALAIAIAITIFQKAGITAGR